MPYSKRRGSASLPGNRYGTLNQDYAVVQELYAPGEVPKSGQTYVGAICDGHGVLGDMSASRAGKALSRYLFSGKLRNKSLAACTDEELEDEMRAAFRKANNAAMSVYDDPPKSILYPKLSGKKVMETFNLCEAGGIRYYKCNGKGPEKLLECGTTCTAIVTQGRTFTLGNVGDSLAVLGKDTGDRYEAEFVTTRHNGFNAEEAERIRTKFADVVAIIEEDGYISVLDGPLVGYELAVTRALGHSLEQYGVLSEPYIKTFRLRPEHRCLVIASDGVWDHMSGTEVVNLVMDSASRGKTATEAAQELVNHAVELGLQSPSEEADNTTAVVVFFE